MKKINTHLYVAELPQEQQDYIEAELTEVIKECFYLTETEKEDAIESGMCEKLCNLSDAIDLVAFENSFYVSA